MSSPPSFFFVMLLIVVGVVIYLRVVGSRNGGSFNAKPILTENESEFFYRLQGALPDFHVFPQVAANAMLKVASGVAKKRYHAVRNQFAQKHVDFVVCERESLKVVAVVELDDRTHNSAKDKKRDAMFEQAGYHVLRFQSKRKPSEQEIVDAIANLHIPPAFEAHARQEPAFSTPAIPTAPPKQNTTW